MVCNFRVAFRNRSTSFAENHISYLYGLLIAVCLLCAFSLVLFFICWTQYGVSSPTLVHFSGYLGGSPSDNTTFMFPVTEPCFKIIIIIHTGELTQKKVSTLIWQDDFHVKPHTHVLQDFSFTFLLAWSTSPNWHLPSPPGLHGVHDAQVTHPLRLEEVIREWVSELWQFLTPGSHTPEPQWPVYPAIRLPLLMLKAEAGFFFATCRWDVLGGAMPLCLCAHGFWAMLALCLCSFSCFGIWVEATPVIYIIYWTGKASGACHEITKLRLKTTELKS